MLGFSLSRTRKQPNQSQKRFILNKRSPELCGGNNPARFFTKGGRRGDLEPRTPTENLKEMESLTPHSPQNWWNAQMLVNRRPKQPVD